MRKLVSLLFLLYSFSLIVQAQDSLLQGGIPASYLKLAGSKAGTVGDKLDKKTQRLLHRMERLEAKMKRKLVRKNSLQATEIIGDTKARYKELRQKTAVLSEGNPYIPGLDTLTTSLKFLQQHPQLLSGIKGQEENLKAALGKVSTLENQLQQAEQIKKFIRERKLLLPARVSHNHRSGPCLPCGDK